MTSDVLTDAARQAVMIGLEIVGPLLLVILGVGLGVILSGEIEDLLSLARPGLQEPAPDEARTLELRHIELLELGLHVRRLLERGCIGDLVLC